MTIVLIYLISSNVLLNFIKDELKIYKVLFLRRTLFQNKNVFAMILSQCREWCFFFMCYAIFYKLCELFSYDIHKMSPGLRPGNPH